jgi:hypothetical protein
MARFLEGSRAGFYARFKRLGIFSQRQVRHDDLDAQLRQFQQLSWGSLWGI